MTESKMEEDKREEEEVEVLFVLTLVRAASVHIISPALCLPVSEKYTLKQNGRSLQLFSSSKRVISDKYTCL